MNIFRKNRLKTKKALQKSRLYGHFGSSDDFEKTQEKFQMF